MQKETDQLIRGSLFQDIRISVIKEKKKNVKYIEFIKTERGKTFESDTKPIETSILIKDFYKLGKEIYDIYSKNPSDIKKVHIYNHNDYFDPFSFTTLLKCKCGKEQEQVLNFVKKYYIPNVDKKGDGRNIYNIVDLAFATHYDTFVLFTLFCYITSNMFSLYTDYTLGKEKSEERLLNFIDKIFEFDSNEDRIEKARNEMIRMFNEVENNPNNYFLCAKHSKIEYIKPDRNIDHEFGIFPVYSSLYSLMWDWLKVFIVNKGEIEHKQVLKFCIVCGNPVLYKREPTTLPLCSEHMREKKSNQRQEQRQRQKEKVE